MGYQNYSQGEWQVLFLLERFFFKIPHLLLVKPELKKAELCMCQNP